MHSPSQVPQLLGSLLVSTHLPPQHVPVRHFEPSATGTQSPEPLGSHVWHSGHLGGVAPNGSGAKGNTGRQPGQVTPPAPAISVDRGNKGPGDLQAFAFLQSP